jgi:4-hydroxy-tetrahydrodipicolinate reductase
MLAKPAYSEQFNLVAAIVSMQSPLKDKPVSHETGLDTSLLFSANLSKYLDHPNLIDVIIDCSLPESSMHTLELAKLSNKKVVLCVTGFNPEQLDNIAKAAQTLPLVVAPNTSIGMNLTHVISKWIAEKVPLGTDIQILETHHIHKKDAPSGAARQLANGVHQAGKLRQLDYPTITSMRQGETVGEHTLFFNFEGEQIQLTHKAFDRSIFALGAISAATWLNQITQPGFYTMEDVMLLNAK